MELERLGKPESQAFEEGMSAGAARVSAALPPEDAAYLSCQQDVEGKPKDGSRHYRLVGDVVWTGWLLCEESDPTLRDRGARSRLPAPKRQFNLTLRMYRPKEQGLQGQGIPPGVTPIH